MNNYKGSLNGEAFFQFLLSKSKMSDVIKFKDYLLHTADEMGQTRSFHTIDLADVLWKAQLWQEKLPNVTPFYAVKANFDPVLLRLFVLLGFSFDCSTEGEMRRVLEAGSDPKNIIFAHTIKPRETLHFAKSVGVQIMTFDNSEELIKIQKHYPDAKLVIRIKPECPRCLMDLSIKYGCPMSDVEKLLQLAKDLCLKVVGVSFHVGGLCEQAVPYVETIRTCRRVFEIADSLGFHLEILDIGAGFQGKIGSDLLFSQFADKIQEALIEYFPDSGVKVIGEPGTFLVASAGTVTTTIIGKRTFSEEDGTDMRKEYYLNESIYGSFFNTICAYDIFPQPLQATEASANELNSRLWGQTCCCEDMLLEKCSLPDMKVGERIFWSNMGSYSRAICSSFTLVPLPETRHVFKLDSRLKLDWIKKLDEVATFISCNSVLVL